PSASSSATLHSALPAHPPLTRASLSGEQRAPAGYVQKKPSSRSLHSSPLAQLPASAASHAEPSAPALGLSLSSSLPQPPKLPRNTSVAASWMLLRAVSFIDPTSVEPER